MLSKISQASTCVLVVVLLAIPIKSAQLANLEKSSQTLIEQTSSVNFSQIPECYKAGKMVEVQNFTNVFEGLVKTLPKKCEQPNSSNFQDCVSTTLEYLKNHIQEIQETVSGGIEGFVDGARSCMSHTTGQFTNLNQQMAQASIGKKFIQPVT